MEYNGFTSEVKKQINKNQKNIKKEKFSRFSSLQEHDFKQNIKHEKVNTLGWCFHITAPP